MPRESFAFFYYVVSCLEGLSAFTALGFAGDEAAIVFSDMGMAHSALD